MVGGNRLSTKLIALVKYLRHLLCKDSTTKSLVFSSFPSILSKVADALKLNGISFLHLTGNAKKRSAIIESFQNPLSTTSVLLLSLKLDASGLTLHAAQNVFLLEPSPVLALEEQAVGRAYRRGQTRKTRVFRFIVSDTIEQDVVALQQRRQCVEGHHTVLKSVHQENLSAQELLDCLHS